MVGVWYNMCIPLLKCSRYCVWQTNVRWQLLTKKACYTIAHEVVPCLVFISIFKITTKDHNCELGELDQWLCVVWILEMCHLVLLGETSCQPKSIAVYYSPCDIKTSYGLDPSAWCAQYPFDWEHLVLLYKYIFFLYAGYGVSALRPYIVS